MSTRRAAPTRFVLVLALSGLAACTYQPSSASDYWNWYETAQTRQLAEERAPFDFQCDTENLTFKRLGSGNTVGVSGCGKRAVYHWVGGTWVLNSDTRSGP